MVALPVELVLLNLKLPKSLLMVALPAELELLKIRLPFAPYLWRVALPPLMTMPAPSKLTVWSPMWRA